MWPQLLSTLSEALGSCCGEEVVEEERLTAGWKMGLTAGLRAKKEPMARNHIVGGLKMLQTSVE
jgi:hypothetical protein